MQNWSLEQNSARLGVVKHHAKPRFIAYWQSGVDGLATIEGQSWRDEQAGDADSQLHIFGFEWIDEPPEEDRFERLMQEAAKIIDAWIESRL